MKKFIKINTLTLTTICLLLSAFSIFGTACAPQSDNGDSDKNDEPAYIQSINTIESIESFNNPDQGFYHPIYVKMNESGISYNKSIVNNSTQLYHLRIDISAFSKKTNGTEDKQLTSDSLNGLDNLLSYLNEKQKNAVVRFAYDPSFGGSTDKEPEPNVIISHIDRICPILNKYETTITAVEAGLIGPWGEMHTSKIANSQTINPIIEHFLNGTKSIPILVRTPKMIYNYLGISINDVDGYELDSAHKAYRLGIYNDGYLGSETDLGTYTNRETEVRFLSKQTNHLPYGGEVVIPDSSLHDIENCLPEMAQLNLSYLNAEWNNEVINKWKNSTYTNSCGSDANYYGQSAFTYISNHMGYRFVLTKSVFEYSNYFDNLSVKLQFDNVGFGNLNKKKQAKLIFVDGNGEIKYTERVGEFIGSEQANYTAELNLANGKYDVYLRVYGDTADDADVYCLRFANCDIWDSALSANKIGEITVQK